MKWSSRILLVVLVMLLFAGIAEAANSAGKAVPWVSKTAILYDTPGGSPIEIITGKSFRVGLIMYDGGDGYLYCYYEGRLGTGFLRITLTPEDGAVAYYM